MRTIILLQIVFAVAAAHAESFVCFEAESSTNVTALMQVGGSGIAVTNKGWSAVSEASGDKYVELPQYQVSNAVDNASSSSGKEPLKGSMSFNFTVSEGTHQLWCRVWWLDTCGNSLSISIDGAKAFSFGQDRTFKSWHWVKAPKRLKQLDLSDGKHTMVISAREDGIRIDQILLTDDPDFVPVGIEDVTETE